jgi:hypothetical protein
MSEIAERISFKNNLSKKKKKRAHTNGLAKLIPEEKSSN